MTIRRIATTTLAFLWLACGGSGGSNEPSISVSPGSATVLAGGAAVPFTATLSNSTNSISWTLTGPGSITPATGTSTSYTPPTSVASSTTATLTASAGAGVSSSVTITVNVPPAITVAGTVIDNSFRRFAGIPVTIGSQNTVTDSNGHFSIANVTPPYDLLAIFTGAGKFASLYKGLTRADPTILIAANGGVASSTGTIGGNVTGGDPLSTVGDVTAVAYGSPNASSSTEFNSNPYSLDLTWNDGAATSTGTIHVLQWAKDVNDVPTSYKGYGTKTGVAVANMGTTAGADVVMSAPTGSSVGGTVVAPAGVTVSGRSMALTFDDTASISLVFDSLSATAFAFPFPSITGGTATVGAQGTNASGDVVARNVGGIAPGTTNASINLPAPVSAILPANAGTGINTTTDFSWTPLSGGIHVFVASGAPGVPHYYVFTSAATARIPDLTAQGLGLPASTSYEWQVIAVGPHANLDSAAGPKSILPAGNDLVEGISNSRAFTTQ